MNDDRDTLRPEQARKLQLVTKVRVSSTPRHDHVAVWNRGAFAGTLTVDKGDGPFIASRLFADEDDAACTIRLLRNPPGTEFAPPDAEFEHKEAPDGDEPIDR